MMTISNDCVVLCFTFPPKLRHWVCYCDLLIIDKWFSLLIYVIIIHYNTSWSQIIYLTCNSIVV